MYFNFEHPIKNGLCTEIGCYLVACARPCPATRRQVTEYSKLGLRLIYTCSLIHKITDRSLKMEGRALEETEVELAWICSSARDGGRSGGVRLCSCHPFLGKFRA